MRIVIPIFEGFTALDAIGPYEVLRGLPDAEVLFVSTTTGPVRTDSGFLAVTADATLADTTSADVLVVPGGPGMRARHGDQAILDWIRRVDATTQWTASVCTGSILLAAAGLLDGVPATTHWSRIELLESLGAKYTPQRVVFNGKLVTAAGVSSGIDMALALAARLTDDLTAQAIQLEIEYDPQPPFDSGSPAKAPAAAKQLLASGRLFR